MLQQEKASLLLTESQSECGELDKALNFMNETQFMPLKQGWKFFKVSLPCISQIFGCFIMNFSSMMAANYINDNKIVAGYGLGLTLTNASLLSVIIALNNGLFTQASHAYGAKNYKLVGILLQRAWIIDSAYLILSFPLIYNLKQILMYFQIEENISDIASKYVLYMFPSIIFKMIFDSLQIYMMAHKEFTIPTIIQNIGQGVVPLYLYFFVIVFKWDIIGISMARNLAELLPCILIIIIILRELKNKGQNSLYYKTWIPWNKEAFKFNEIKDYLKLSAVIGAVIYLEWSFFEIQTIIVASMRDDAILAAHSSFVGIMQFFYMIPMGLSLSVNSYFGNLMGQGKARVAENFAKVSVMTTIAITIITNIIGWIIKPIFLAYFTTDEKMAHYFEVIYLIYINFFFFPDSLQFVLGSILRCLGKQNSAAIGFLVTYYGIGMPLTFFLTFTCGFGVYGVWITFGIVASLVVFYFLYKLVTSDFKQCSQDIIKGLGDEQNKDDVELKNIQK